MTTELKNIVFIGGSCAAMGPSINWIENPIKGYRIIIIEEKSHFNHVFAFPRASVISGFEHELFIPYDNMFNKDETVGKVIQARATAIHRDYVELDRDVLGFGQKVEYAYLVYAAGTKIPAPGRFNELHTREDGIAALKMYQKAIEKSQRPVVIGAGAVGLELAAEIKEKYPEKHVTLVHSRHRYLPKYKVSMDVMIQNILKKLGVDQVLGNRVVLPPGGFPLEVKPIDIQTKNGKTIQGDLAIMCIGMTPNNEIMKEFSANAIHEQTGFIKIKQTMQIQDDTLQNVFAVGDVAEHTDVKTGHYAWMQGLAALTNIRHLIEGKELEPYKEAVMQTHVLGPLIAVGSWIAGRSIPYNIYATATKGYLKATLPEEESAK